MNKNHFCKTLFTRCVSLALSGIMAFSIGVTAFADDASRENLPGNEENMLDFVEAQEMTSEEFTETIEKMGRFVTVNKDGQFEFDEKGAEEAGIGEEIVLAQSDAFEEMNQEISEGKLQVCENMELEVLNEDSRFYSLINDETGDECEHVGYCHGGRTTSARVMWWGVQRYTCDCETRRNATQLRTIAKWYVCYNKLVAVLGTLFGYPVYVGTFDRAIRNIRYAVLSYSYINTIAYRMNQYNYGRGINLQLLWSFSYCVIRQ